MVLSGAARCVACTWLDGVVGGAARYARVHVPPSGVPRNTGTYLGVLDTLELANSAAVTIAGA